MLAPYPSGRAYKRDRIREVEAGPMVHEIRFGRIRRDRGFNVGRPTSLGNPYRIGPDGDRAEVIAKYRVWLADRSECDPRVRAALERLTSAASRADITLLCSCAPQACHAEVIAEAIEARLRRCEARVDLGTAPSTVG